MQLFATWHHGYPEPSDDFGYLEETYDTSNLCKTCGIGAHQKAAFLLQGEPRWGKNHVMQLNWVFDEFFVRPETWEKIFKPLGVAFRPVLHVKSRKVLETVVQLDIPQSDIAIQAKGYPSETCAM